MSVLDDANMKKKKVSKEEDDFKDDDMAAVANLQKKAIP